jgi:hypothetical protein
VGTAVAGLGWREGRRDGLLLRWPNRRGREGGEERVCVRVGPVVAQAGKGERGSQWAMMRPRRERGEEMSLGCFSIFPNPFLFPRNLN